MSDSANPSLNPNPIGFKEWAYVCEALGQGAQSIILRKGGIHEGKRGFQFEHKDFWLFPTGFHAQGEQLRWIPENAGEVSVPQDEQRESVDIRHFVKLEQVWRVTDWNKVAALEPLHVWTEEVVRERFAWNEESCLHVALVRAFTLPEVWSFPYEPKYGGCRSWVKLPEEGQALEGKLKSVLTDEAWWDIEQRAREVLD
jgi:hypothetical protein